ncbi:MAG: hypothetical protein WA977_13590 [Halobacteriota archaeon]
MLWGVERDGMLRGTSQPTMQIFFCKCILQGAIDFAEVRMRKAELEAWQALHLYANF